MSGWKHTWKQNLVMPFLTLKKNQEPQSFKPFHAPQKIDVKCRKEIMRGFSQEIGKSADNGESFIQL